MTKSAPPAGGVQALILDRKGDRSYERLSRDCGGRPSAAALQKTANSPLKAFPDVESMVGLSKGLNVPVREVLFACARSVGINVGLEDDNVLPIIGGRTLPKSSQDLILSMARELLTSHARLSASEEQPSQHDLDLAARAADEHVGAEDIETTT